ncbi:tail protein [Clostridium phage phiCP39-O]|uniref:tail protein n=1 Tax=Clostridium phage phiCP39-O TaxID=541865 RepID=UPI000181BCFA|nr:tail protein [Clostridium phage phiCP39-O]ACE82008.1 gp58-like protein [Clostridium phage phiCP39-O]
MATSLFDNYKQKLTELQKEKQNAVAVITNNKDLVVYEELNSKFNLQNDKIGLEVSKLWQGVNNVEENTISKIEILDDKITLESERKVEGNPIVNGAFESENIFGWNVGGTNISITTNYTYLGKRNINYINVTPTSINGSSSWSNRFSILPSTEYTLSGLFFTGISTKLGIKVKFSNSIKEGNDFEKEGKFDEEINLGNWISEDDSFIPKHFTFITPANAKSAFLEFYYYEATNYCGWTEIMLTKGKQPSSYVSKTASYSKVFQQLTPDSIINSVNKGLAEGGAISVASTILDENGFSQLNRGKLSVKLNNNGTHIYSFLQDDKINGSLQALRNVVTGDDVVGLTNEKGAYAQIAYRGDGSNYYNYMRFDKEGLTQPTPITVYEEFDMNGLNMFFNKKNQESRIFGYLDSRNRGSVALYTNNFGFWSNDGSGHSLLTLDRDVANFYNRVIIGGDLSVIGNKNCIQQTKFGDVPFYANEDINSLLTETDTDTIYTTELVEDKYICRIEIDEIIQECINTTLHYNVYIDKLSWGDYKVEVREKDYFIVESDREMKFKYKLEGKRKGFEHENKENNFMQKATVQKPSQETETPSIQKREKEIIHKKPINEFWELYRCNNCN